MGNLGKLEYQYLNKCSSSKIVRRLCGEISLQENTKFSYLSWVQSNIMPRCTDFIEFIDFKVRRDSQIIYSDLWFVTDH